MKRLRIEHRTVYRYTEPVKFGLHRIVLRPREGHDTTVIKHTITLIPEGKLFWLIDLYGNNVALAEISTPSDRLEILNEAILERVGGVADEAPQRITQASVLPLPLVYPQLELPVLQGYLAPVYMEDAGAVQQWVAGELKEHTFPTALLTVMHLNQQIHHQITYRRREERGVQSPGCTLSLKTGSCRDMATLLMEAVRSLGIAARFVSGYLDSSASAAGRGATHAWVEVYLPDSGWCGFDPTVGNSVSRSHVPVGVSAHPRGVMPISGIYDGPSGSYLGLQVEISIRPWDAAAEA